MKTPILQAATLALLISPFMNPHASAAEESTPSTQFLSWAQTPPMGWNSWDCFGTTVTEAQTKAQADYMAANLKAHGWQYIVVDIQWYEPHAKSHAYREGAPLTMDGFGRLLPAPNRFPSAKNGKGFSELATYVHSLGLKFGIHLMRGIPRQAVEENLPVLGTEKDGEYAVHAQDIADKVHVCPWNPDMYGVDMSKAGAQEYYDSVFDQIADWGVDFIKVDDLSRPYFQNQAEVEAIRRAIDKTGRPIVLSLSPGATDIHAAEHVNTHANMWRISDDFWDRWMSLREQFGRLERWNPYRTSGAWPDADMLPLGTLVMGERTTRFTPDEQMTLMTLWAIARSPLMHGGDMTKTDPETLALLTNDAVLAVNQQSCENAPLFDHDGLIGWKAKDPVNGDTYLALFNARNRVRLTEKNASQYAARMSASPSTSVSIDIPLKGGKKVFFAALPLSEADNSTPVIWTAPRVVLADGSVRSLLAQPWTHADAQWDAASVKEDEGGDPLLFVALAPAVIEYALPEGATRLLANAKVDADSHGQVELLTVVGTDGNEDKGPGLPVEVNLGELMPAGKVRIVDLWTGEDLGEHEGSFAPIVPFHGARLYRLCPAE